MTHSPHPGGGPFSFPNQLFYYPEPEASSHYGGVGIGRSSCGYWVFLEISLRSRHETANIRSG